MDMNKHNNKILELNTLIYACCDLLSLNHPYIYYLISSHNDFQLYDLNGKLISTDKRDASLFNINGIDFVKRENSFYINIKCMGNITETKILIIRKIRENFQYKQVHLFINKKNIEVTEYRVVQWKYCIEGSAFKSSYKSASPTELDKNAFATLIMSGLYNIGVNYDFGADSDSKIAVYNETLLELETRYSLDIIKTAYSKYNI